MHPIYTLPSPDAIAYNEARLRGICAELQSVTAALGLDCVNVMVRNSNTDAAAWLHRPAEDPHKGLPDCACFDVRTSLSTALTELATASAAERAKS